MDCKAKTWQEIKRGENDFLSTSTHYDDVMILHFYAFSDTASVHNAKIIYTTWRSKTNPKSQWEILTSL